VTELKIETNRNPGHNQFHSQIKIKQYMNQTDHTVKLMRIDRLDITVMIQIYSQFSHASTEWYSNTTVNHNLPNISYMTNSK
jgi:hypothetical protein